jgi:hypothetical protein
MVNVVRMNKFSLDGGLADDMASDALMSSGATTLRGKPCRSGTDESDGNLRNLSIESSWARHQVQGLSSESFHLPEQARRCTGVGRQNGRENSSGRNVRSLSLAARDTGQGDFIDLRTCRIEPSHC